MKRKNRYIEFRPTVINKTFACVPYLYKEKARDVKARSEKWIADNKSYKIREKRFSDFVMIDGIIPNGVVEIWYEE